jgi:hypothetical protein
MDNSSGVGVWGWSGLGFGVGGCSGGVMVLGCGVGEREGAWESSALGLD